MTTTKVQVQEKPLTEWQSTWVELMGAQVKVYQGSQWYLRGIEMGDPSNEPLILLHGIGGHGETYARNIPNLAKHFHVYSLDLLYHGYSQKEPFDGEHIVDGYVDSLVDFIDTQGLHRPHIEGESLGSIVCFHLGLKYPGKAGKLILNTGAPVTWKDRPGFRENPEGFQALARTSLDAVNNPTPETIRRRLEVADGQAGARHGRAGGHPPQALPGPRGTQVDEQRLHQRLRGPDAVRELLG